MLRLVIYRNVYQDSNLHNYVSDSTLPDDICTQGLFTAGTPGNGVPKVILAVGTAFPGKSLVIRYIFVNEP